MDRPTLRPTGRRPAAPVGGRPTLTALALAVVALAVVGSPAVVLAGPAAAAGPAGGVTSGAATRPAFGTVAAITGTSMEVQNQQTGQVTVGWTASTTFTQDATVAASSVATGDCVMVVGTSSKGKITAQTVSVSPRPSSGRCTAGGPQKAAGPGTNGGGTGSPVRISGGSSQQSQQFAGPPGGQATHGSGAPGIANGQVLSVSGNRLVLSGFSSTAMEKAAGRNGKATGRRDTKTVIGQGDPGKAQVVSVVLSPTTTYTETQPAAAIDLAVGDCVVANGPAAANGAVTAKAVQITATGGKSCTTGSGVRVIGGGPQTNGAQTGSSLGGLKGSGGVTVSGG